MDEKKEITLEIPAVDAAPEDSPAAASPAEDGPTLALPAEDGPTVALPAEKPVQSAQQAVPAAGQPAPGAVAYGQPAAGVPASGQPAPETAAYGQSAPEAPAPHFAPPLADFEPPAEPQRQRFPVVLIPVFLLILLVAAGLGVYLFLNSGKNLLLVGIEKTFGEERMLKDFADAAQSGAYTADYGLEVKLPKGIAFGMPAFTVNAEASQRVNLPDKELSFTGKVETLSVSQSFAAYMNDREILVALPNLVKTVLKYDYTEDKKDSYLSEVFRDGEGPEQWDEYLTDFWETMESQKELNEEYKALLLQFIGELKPEKLDAEEFPVDGKQVKCKGYRYQVTGDQVQKLWNDMRDLMDKKASLPEYLEDSLGDLDEEVEDALDEMKDITVKVYIWKGRFADIQIESKDMEDIEICFLGGNYPTENMEIVTENGALEIYGSAEEDFLTRRISVIDEDKKETELVYLDYTPSTHSMKFTFPEELMDEIHEGVEFSFTMALTKGAEVETVEEGKKVLDIGSASEKDFEEFMAELEEQSQKLMGDLTDY